MAHVSEKHAPAYPVPSAAVARTDYPRNCTMCETRPAVLCKSCYVDDHSPALDDLNQVHCNKCDAMMVIGPRAETATPKHTCGGRIDSDSEDFCEACIAQRKKSQ